MWALIVDLLKAVLPDIRKVLGDIAASRSKHEREDIARDILVVFTTLSAITTHGTKILGILEGVLSDDPQTRRLSLDQSLGLNGMLQYQAMDIQRLIDKLEGMRGQLMILEPKALRMLDKLLPDKWNTLHRLSIMVTELPTAPVRLDPCRGVVQPHSSVPLLDYDRGENRWSEEQTNLIASYVHSRNAHQNLLDIQTALDELMISLKTIFTTEELLVAIRRQG